jgi:hypothetical protein
MTLPIENGNKTQMTGGGETVLWYDIYNCNVVCLYRNKTQNCILSDL